MTIDHAKREHASISPSAMSRTVRCPWSAFASSFIPSPPTSEASKEGTTAHEFAEKALRAMLFKEPLKVKKGEYTDHMKASGLRYAGYIYNLIKPHLKKPNDIWIEEELMIDKDKDFWGTADFVFNYVDDDKTMHSILIDYKYGRIPVSAKKNWQLVSYLMGVKNTKLYSYSGYKMGNATVIVFQPRLADDLTTYEPDIWYTSFGDLDTTMFEVLDSVATIVAYWIERGQCSPKDEKEYTRPGDHCHWCNAKPICKAYKEKTATTVMGLFKEGLNKLPKKDLRSPEKLLSAGFLEMKDILEIHDNKTDIIKFVESVAEIPKLIVSSGYDIKGYKAVEVTPKREWIDDEVKLEEGLRKLGVTTPYVEVKKFITMGEVDKVVTDSEKLKDLLKEKEASYKIVKEDVDGKKYNLKVDFEFNNAFSDILEKYNKE